MDSAVARNGAEQAPMGRAEWAKQVGPNVAQMYDRTSQEKALLTYGFTKMDYSGTGQNMSDPSNSDNNRLGPASRQKWLREDVTILDLSGAGHKFTSFRWTLKWRPRRVSTTKGFSRI